MFRASVRHASDRVHGAPRAAPAHRLGSSTRWLRPEGPGLRETGTSDGPGYLDPHGDKDNVVYKSLYRCVGGTSSGYDVDGVRDVG